MIYFISLQGKFSSQMPFEYVSSFGTHPLWISAKLGMERWCKVFYMPTGEIRDSDAIRVCFEFQDSSFMDSRQIKYEASPAKKVNR